MATSPLPCEGPKRGQNYDVTLVFSGVPNKGDKIRSGYLTAALSRAQKRAALLPCIVYLLMVWSVAFKTVAPSAARGEFIA